jgi:hypothetical protein
VTVTSLVYQPLLPRVPEVTAAEVLGLVRSMLMPLTVVLVLLPATSVTVKVTDWLAPSVLKT